MGNNVIEVTGISEPLLKLIDERVGSKGGDRAAYVRLPLIFQVTKIQKPYKGFLIL